MVFSSLSFLFFYLPLVLLLYYLTPLKWRNPILLVCNLVFYAWGEPIYICIMFASILVDYLHGFLVTHYLEKGKRGHAKFAVASSVFFNLAMLLFFKYWDFIAMNLQSIGLNFMPVLGLGLPIGISFYTFQTMSYTIDVYRGDANRQKNLVSFGVYVTLFPQLIAGPIVRYKDLSEQLTQRTHSLDKFSRGITLFCIGLAKKVLLANQFGQLYDAAVILPRSTASAWLAAVAFALQIYFDFCGYSEMAMGLGNMLGFTFPKNFHYPYLANSITDFWRRWHITLGTWFRDYLYIPLGGSRVSAPRLALNLLLVWAATGIWHGASWNFLFWGLYFCALLILEKLFLLKILARLPKLVAHGYTLIAIGVSWIIFATEDISKLGSTISAMFFVGAPMSTDTVFYYLCTNLPLLLVGVFAATPLASYLWKRLPRRGMTILLPILVLLALLLSTAYLVDATYNPFLYFRF